MDVRMLGRGRPFVLQVFNPRSGPPSAEVLQSVQERIAKVCAPAAHLLPLVAAAQGPAMTACVNCKRKRGRECGRESEKERA